MSEEKKEGPSKKEAKAALEAAKTELKEIMSKNNIKEDTDLESLDKPVRKAYKAARAKVDELRAAWKALKGTASGRTSTYNYPEGMTDAKEKKRFRAKQRAEAKRAEKGEAAPKKKEKAEEAPAKKKKTSDD